MTLITILTRRVKFQPRNQKDASIFHHRFPLCWQQNLFEFSPSTNLTYARKSVLDFPLDRGLQSVILLHEGSFDWKCLSMWPAKENLVLMKTEYFLVFILPSTQKTSWFYHRHTGIKCQMPVSYLQHALFPTDTHSQVSWHKTKHKGSRHTPASQQCKEKLSINWIVAVFSMRKRLISLPQFCNSN